MSNVITDVWKRVDRRTDEECWEWQGARNSKGYGQMRVSMRQHASHRLAYQAATGTDPADLHVLHRCDNPPCCNPAHLFLGTAGDNVRDCAAKGRNCSGSRHPRSKLNEAAVADIRWLSSNGAMGTELAAQFGVTPQMVSNIINRKNWAAV